MKKNNTIKTKWDLSKIFRGDNDPNMKKESKIIEKLSSEFVSKWKEKDNYLYDPNILLEALDEYEYFWRLHGPYAREYFYYELKNALDQSDHMIKAKLNKAIDKSKKIENDLQFFTLNISKIKKEYQKKFLENAGLQKYKHFLEKVFESAKYNLSEAEEKILNLEDTPARSNWIKMTKEFLSKEEAEVIDEDGKKKKKNYEDIFNLISSKKPKVRDSAAAALNEIFKKHSDVAEHEINSVLKCKQINDELRGLERPDKSRHITDDIESEVVDTLISTIQKRFSISQRYYRLKAKMMGVKRLKYHEKNIEYGEVNKKYNFTKSVGLVNKTLNKLDSQFSEIFQSFLKNGQIDVYPSKGKTHGGFCADVLPTTPTYILLNHNDRLEDVLTIAHETGHGINTQLMKQKIHSLDFGLTTLNAEVASTFMEDFVLEEILKDADDDLRLNIMMQRLNDNISTIQRQIACYIFEQELHREFREKGYLFKKEIGALFQKNMKAYMGESVEQSEGSENWWIYWGHIRKYFYVYSYAGGLLISKALQNSVKKNPDYIEKLKYFLSAGTSESPKNIFRKIGIDITKKEFWDKGLDEVEELLSETEKLARRLHKIK